MAIAYHGWMATVKLFVPNWRRPDSLKGGESVGRNEQAPLLPELRSLFPDRVVDSARCPQDAFALFRKHVARPLFRAT